jgi:hypothetical protein
MWRKWRRYGGCVRQLARLTCEISDLPYESSICGESQARANFSGRVEEYVGENEYTQSIYTAEEVSKI